MKKGGSPPGHFYNPCYPSTATSNFSSYSPFQLLFLPIRSRESLSKHTHTDVHTDTHSEWVPPHTWPFQCTHIFCALHFKNMKGCSAGTKAKARVGGGGEVSRRREASIKAVLERGRCIRDGGGGGGGVWCSVGRKKGVTGGPSQPGSMSRGLRLKWFSSGSQETKQQALRSTS